MVSLIIKYGNTTKNPNTIKGCLIIFRRFLNEYPICLLRSKDIINFGKKYIIHSNQQIKSTATQLLCGIYSIAGDQLKPLLKTDLKENVIKTLEIELTKTQRIIPKIIRCLKGETEKEFNDKNKEKNLVNT